ncbi:unnamed protein product [Lepeophtheirus salmonis]|uniref:(salmon louse) hypothetical protein n=1 Tax=Lepeophtheirus salmonis TaxID=72036 RepID=A0A7R8CGX4_LEPSM|nr:unnamed protein product [Lepeophtheirus salmonis]CAF2819328.1 unnamed protein product [Lepeophtheirus salmonis]
MSPLSIAENRGFKRFAAAFDDCYNLASCKTLTNVSLRNLYDEDQKRVVQTIHEVGWISLTNNANNVIAAVKGHKFKKMQSIGCFAHSLNLMVEDAFLQVPALSTLKNKVLDIVTTTKKSSTTIRSFNEALKEGGSSHDALNDSRHLPLEGYYGFKSFGKRFFHKLTKAMLEIEKEQTPVQHSVQQVKAPSQKVALSVSFRRSPNDRRVSNANMEIQFFLSKWLDPEKSIIN